MMTKEVYPLSWPDEWTRTRPQDRRAMAAWKRTANQYHDALEKELTRMGRSGRRLSIQAELFTAPIPHRH